MLRELEPITSRCLSKVEFHKSLFEAWLREQGGCEGTVSHYIPAVERWLGVVNSSPEEAGITWLRWRVSPAVKRLTGFAVRKYETFYRDVFGKKISLGISAKLPPSTRPNPHPFSENEVKLLLKSAKTTLQRRHANLSMRVFIHVICTLGLRRQEAFFEWSDVDFEQKTVTVLGKGGDFRTLPMTSRLTRILKFWKQKSPNFPWTTVNGLKVLPSAMYQNFKRVARAAGIPDARLHWFRHTRLTAMAAAPSGYDPIHLAAFAGHRQLSSLTHYCKPSMNRLREMLSATF